MAISLKTVSLSDDDLFALRHVLLMRRLELVGLLKGIAEDPQYYTDFPAAKIFGDELDSVERLLTGPFRSSL